MAGLDPAVRTVPSATSPVRDSVFGPSPAASTGTVRSGGQASFTRSRRTYRPDVVTSSPARSRRSAGTYSRMSVNGEATRAPACPIQSSTPCPNPKIARPG